MNVVLFAYQTWGHRVLQALTESRHEVVLVATHPPGDDAYETIWTDSVQRLAEQHGLPVLVKALPDDETAARVRDAGADVMVACNWRTWIPPEIFAAPRLGTLNVHDSLLPAYAGFAPLNWAVINGEPEVGITAHVMDERLDRGAIILQPRVTVEPDDTIGDLFAKTLMLFGPTTVAALDHMEHGTGERRPQDPAQATFFHKRAEEDSRIDWIWPAQDIANLVRAQADPYPNAFSFHGAARLQIRSASVSPTRAGGTPGRIFARQGDGVIIVCGPDARRGRNHGLVIEQLRTEDGEELAAGDYFKRLGGYLTAHPGDPDRSARAVGQRIVAAGAAR
ncbi:MAG: methionyl-tRNA formyltransferase [Solirubrobacteraceae bacterium MAG38_C4-C5]|nr:methionyl-tRNA formyltransferase [Candidatus Siliceabacter maunaloa]